MGTHAPPRPEEPKEKLSKEPDVRLKSNEPEKEGDSQEEKENENSG
jgi:hypothetical protein